MTWIGSYEENKFYQPQLLHLMYKSLPSNRRIYNDIEKGSHDSNNSFTDDGEIGKYFHFA